MATKQLTEAMDSLRERVTAKGVDIGILAGREVARFMLRYGSDILLR